MRDWINDLDDILNEGLVDANKDHPSNGGCDHSSSIKDSEPQEEDKIEDPEQLGEEFVAVEDYCDIYGILETVGIDDMVLFNTSPIESIDEIDVLFVKEDNGSYQQVYAKATSVSESIFRIYNNYAE